MHFCLLAPPLPCVLTCSTPSTSEWECFHVWSYWTSQSGFVGTVPFTLEICCWTASTKLQSAFLFLLLCSMCPGENIKCVHKIHAKIVTNTFRKVLFLLKKFYLNLLCLKIEQKKQTNMRQKSMQNKRQ